MTRWSVPEGTHTKVFAGYDARGNARTRQKPVAYRVDHTHSHVNWNNSKSINGLETEPRYWFDGEMYCKNDPENKFWTCLGYAPRPVTDWDFFRHDFLLGMMGKFGFFNCICFAIRHYFRRKKKRWLS